MKTPVNEMSEREAHQEAAARRYEAILGGTLCKRLLDQIYRDAYRRVTAGRRPRIIRYVPQN